MSVLKVWDGSAWVEAIGSTFDHGGLGGLADDDHTQYVLRSITSTKGQLLAETGSALAALSAGADGAALVAKSSVSRGLGYARCIHMCVPMLSNPQSDVIDTNQPAAARLFRGTGRSCVLVDLTEYTQCRMAVTMQSVAANASATMNLVYKTGGFSSTYGDFSEITSTGACSVATDTTFTTTDSGWLTLASGAIADSVTIALATAGGDGAIDPRFSNAMVYFRR